jgi:hypothetical protein
LTGLFYPQRVIEMLTNFRFFALTYLSDWWQYDDQFVRGLRPQAKSRREYLEKAANYYQVSRSFSDDYDGPAGRLDKALTEVDAMLLTVNNVITPTNVDATVTTLAQRLGSIYLKKKTGKPQNLISAASKFLWLRRRSPVVIYDGRAVATLTALQANTGETYSSYRSAWRAEFPKYEVRIRSACSNLSHSSVKNFAPDGTAKIRLNSVLRTRWFHERVFDKFLWWNGT